MSTTFETPAQYERDLRSSNKEWKRKKDSHMKWAHGARPLCREALCTAGEHGWEANGEDNVKVRPRGKMSECGNPPKHNNQNISTKFTRKQTSTAPFGRWQSKATAGLEIADAATSRSILDLLPVHHNMRQQQAAESGVSGVLYSFDRAETTPGKPVTLEVFVKAPTNRTVEREEERFVEKEYEILDTSGATLKGRKARQTLRKAASGTSTEEEPVVDEDGFEIV